jgi:hypothetical protein
MPFITIGSASQLQIKVPTRGTTNWDETMRTDTFLKIAQHDHSGTSGNGTQLTATAIADDAITGAKIRLDNNENLTARNQADSGDLNLLKASTSDELVFGITIATADFQDDGLTISDNADNTKKTAIDSSAITTGTTRTLTTPDASGTIVLNDNTATLTNKTLTTPIISSISNTGTVTLPTATTTLVGRDTTDTLTNKSIDSDNNTITNIVNADIKAAAAIAVNKLAATTASRALASDGSGFITAATTTATELDYVSGVTSAIQTQLDTKITASSTDTLTNKTIDADGTGNSITNIEDANIKAAAAIDASKIADGTVSNTEFQYINSVSSNVQDQLDALSAGSAIQKNYLINGNMDIWQRGTAFTGVGNEYTADRWAAVGTSAAVWDVNRSTTIPTVAQSGFQSEYSLQADCTTADASVAAGDVEVIRQFIEGKNFQEIHQQQVTLSFWVYATKTGTSCVSFLNSAQDRNYIAEYTISSSNTWEKKAVTLTLDTSGTWLFNNGKGMEVAFALMAGTTYQGTASTWQAGQLYATSSQVNHMDSSSNVFHIAQVKLEKSSSATDFRRFADGIEGEIIACERYYQKSYNIDTDPGTNTEVGSVHSSDGFDRHTSTFRTRMRAVPSMVYYSTTGASSKVRNRSLASDATPTSTGDGESCSTIGGLGTGSGYHFNWHYTAAAEL